MVDIVCEPNVSRYYGNNPQLVEKYRKIAESGECPFCPENIMKEFQPIRKIGFWNVVFNQYPYKNSALHLLIIPERHVVSLSEITRGEWLQMWSVMSILVDEYPLLSKGYGLAIRENKIGGVTLYHLHWHLIAPVIGPDGQIPVNFGIG